MTQNNTEMLIRSFFDAHQYISVARLESLLYLAEIIHTERTNGTQLTNASFTPEMYQMKSQTVQNTAKQISQNSKEITETYESNKTHGYQTDSYTVNSDTEINTLCDLCIRLTQNKSNAELSKWSKQTYLYNETDYGTPVNFTSYANQLQTSNPDWRKLL